MHARPKFPLSRDKNDCRLNLIKATSHLILLPAKRNAEDNFVLWGFLKKGPGGGEKRARKDGSDITALYLLFSTGGRRKLHAALPSSNGTGRRKRGEFQVEFLARCFSPLLPLHFKKIRVERERERVRNEAVMNKFRIQIAKLKRER